MRGLFGVSSWLHKYVGLVLLPYLMLEGATGILLNHPDLIAGGSVPGHLIPPQYRLADWNRGALKSLTYSKRDPSVAYAWGRQGVWKTTDGGGSFTSLNRGLPEEPFYRRTASLLLVEGDPAILLAGTGAGLFRYDDAEKQWFRVELGETDEPIRRVLKAGNQVVVFTSSRAWVAGPVGTDLAFREARLDRNEKAPRIPLVKLLFDLHGGRIWGLPGRLLFDVAGAMLCFLSISAFYLWYMPKRIRKSLASLNVLRTAKPRLLEWFHTYHLKLGIWFAVVFLVLGGTALFMRPPLIAVPLGHTIPAGVYPGPRCHNPWHDRIINAVYDPTDDRLIVEADGFWLGPADFRAPFERIESPPPVFAMGTTVFEHDSGGAFIVGSFGGLFRWHRSGGRVLSLLDGVAADDRVLTRPADFMVTGYFETPSGEAFAAGH